MHWRRWRCGPARHPDIVKVVDGQALPDAQAGHVGVALTCWQHLHRDVELLPFWRLELDVAKAKRGVGGQIADDQLGRRAILLAFDPCPEADRVPKDAARHVERSERDLRDALVPEGARHLDKHAEGPLARGGGVLGAGGNVGGEGGLHGLGGVHHVKRKILSNLSKLGETLL